MCRAVEVDLGQEYIFYIAEILFIFESVNSYVFFTKKLKKKIYYVYKDFISNKKIYTQSSSLNKALLH